MRARSIRTSLFVLGIVIAVGCAVAAQGAPGAQSGRGAQPRGAAAAAAGTQIHGTLIQVMRGILLPSSNVLFFAQAEDPEGAKPEETEATSPNPILLPRPAYGGWVAVANAGISMAEAANLITIPGRRCSNGRPVPVDDANWKKFVQELRDAGMAAYKAGLSRNQDTVLEVAEQVTMACGNCHDMYREKTDAQGGLKARCTP